MLIMLINNNANNIPYRNVSNAYGDANNTIFNNVDVNNDDDDNGDDDDDDDNDAYSTRERLSSIKWFMASSKECMDLISR